MEKKSLSHFSQSLNDLTQTLTLKANCDSVVRMEKLNFFLWVPKYQYQKSLFNYKVQGLGMGLKYACLASISPGVRAPVLPEKLQSSTLILNR